MKLTTYLVYKFNRFLKCFIRLNILDTERSIDFLLGHPISLARFGDGEMNIIMGGDVHFQSYNKELAIRLLSLLKNNKNSNLLIGIPLAINSTDGYKKNVKEFWEMNMDTGRMHWIRYSGIKRQFLNASLTRCYIDYEQKTMSKIWFEKLMLLWFDKKILIVEGETSKLGVNNSLFSNVSSIDRIITSSSNAWSKYDLLLKGILEVAYDYDMILVSLGPTATILAEDISTQGHRIIDIGHLNLEYNKYVEDGWVEMSTNVIDDKNYFTQIVKQI
ncbi:MAG: hypothetical protein B7Y83_04125 [Flavobacteriales bacterium 32-34-25]|nr:MAG: hypothetical protein B7Y83_04125 [Flavobacteriales bacterium 32-34-25]